MRCFSTDFGEIHATVILERITYVIPILLAGITISPSVMNIELLRHELRKLPNHEQADLRAFVIYRGLEKKLATRLLELLLKTPQPATDQQLAAHLGAPYGSYRNSKTELANTVLEWRAMNATEWPTPELRQLCMAHVQMHWGAVKEARATAQKVQDSSEMLSHFNVARLALELKSTLVQHLKPDNTMLTLSAIIEETDRMTAKAAELNACATIYAHIGRLADQSMLLRNKTGMDVKAMLSRNLSYRILSCEDHPFSAWSYRLQGQAMLALFDGEVKQAFESMHQIWLRLLAHPTPLPASEYRFYQLLQAYIELALKANEWQHALEANALYGTTIRRHFAADPLLMAVHETFQVLAHIGRDSSDARAQAEFRTLIGRLRAGRTVGHADYDLQHWNLHISAYVVLMVIRRAYHLGWYEEATKMLGPIKMFKAKNISSATDLQDIAPLIDLVLSIETAGDVTTASEVKTFASNCTACYDHFRKKAKRYPVEMELARLFRGLAHSSKDSKAQFQKTAHRLASLSTTTPYYKALMQMFDFETWVVDRANGKG